MEVSDKQPRVEKVTIDCVPDRVKMIVFLNNGTQIDVPINTFPRLRNASISDLQKWTLIGSGEGIRWHALDEDISVYGLMKGKSVE